MPRANSAWAHRAGYVDDALLARLLDDPWFGLAPPKSTGRHQCPSSTGSWSRLTARVRPAGRRRAGDPACELTARHHRRSAAARHRRRARREHGWSAAAACTQRVPAFTTAQHVELADMRIESTAALRTRSRTWSKRWVSPWLARATSPLVRPGNLPSKSPVHVGLRGSLGRSTRPEPRASLSTKQPATSQSARSAVTSSGLRSAHGHACRHKNAGYPHASTIRPHWLARLLAGRLQSVPNKAYWVAV